MNLLYIFWYRSFFMSVFLNCCWSADVKDMCAEGSMQSPIDICQRDVEDTELPPLRFSNHWESDLNLFMVQGGNSIIIKPGENFPLSLVGGPLIGTYLLDQLHFHWCMDDNNGTEHSIDGCKYAMEVHLVYYNCIYGCGLRAISQPGGIAIAAVMMESKPIYHNTMFDVIVSQLYKLSCPDVCMPLAKNIIKMLRDTLESQEYYTYVGSLTTPPCSEDVLWMVFKQVINIDTNQVALFRKVHKESGTQIICNVRSIQPLNGRTIYDVTPSCSCPDDISKKKKSKVTKCPY